MSIDIRTKRYGKVFGDWSISDLLGKGSEGEKSVVFKLFRNNLTYNEVCAMKVINIIEKYGKYDEMIEEYKDSYNKECDRLCHKAEDEVRLMYKLRNSNNIVRYLDYRFETWTDKDAYGVDLLIRMDLLDNIGTFLQNGYLYKEEEIIKIGCDICEALVECHTLGIIHRDIKPDNIFKNSNNKYMLGDFGISKMVENSRDVTTMVGTRAYAAPEQFRQEGVSSYDLRVDIYSLGLTLYELANKNKLPFAESNYVTSEEIACRISGVRFKNPSEVSEDLGRVILKACEYKKENRFSNAAEFLYELNNLKENNKKEDKEDLYATVPALDISEYRINQDSKENNNEDKNNGILDKAEFDTLIYKKEIADKDYIAAMEKYNKKNDEDAFILFLKSYKKGNILSGIKLGQMYHYGYGCKQSYYVAQLLFELGEKNKNPLGVIWNIEYLRKGYIESINRTLSIQLFEKWENCIKNMCKSGDADIQYMYGMYLYLGINGKKDKDTGIKWINSSKIGGNRDAVEFLKTI